jgi:hypothetical protein
MYWAAVVGADNVARAPLEMVDDEEGKRGTWRPTTEVACSDERTTCCGLARSISKYT